MPASVIHCRSTTARDLAILGLEADRKFPEYRRFFQAAAVTIDGKEIKSNNLLLTRFIGTIGMKTGFLCASGRNFVGLATRNGKRVMVVIMGATTERERNERSALYLTLTFDGRLPPTAGAVEAVQNRTDMAPVDMRVKLSTDKSAAYEAARDALYQMGLPGHETYLGDPIPGQVRAISTWRTKRLWTFRFPCAARRNGQRACQARLARTTPRVIAQTPAVTTGVRASPSRGTAPSVARTGAREPITALLAGPSRVMAIA